MASVIACIDDLRFAQRLREAFGEGVRFVRVLTQLTATYLAYRADLVVLQCGEGDTSIRESALGFLSRQEPPPVVALLTDLRAQPIREVVQLAQRFDVVLVIRGIDDGIDSLRKLTEASMISGTVRRVTVALGRALPGQLATVAGHVVKRVPGPLSARGLAREFGLPQRTIGSWIHAVGLPGTRWFIGACRMLMAIDLMRAMQCSGETVSKVLGYSSASHLHTQAKRILGVRLSQAVEFGNVDRWSDRLFRRAGPTADIAGDRVTIGSDVLRETGQPQAHQ